MKLVGALISIRRYRKNERADESVHHRALPTGCGAGKGDAQMKKNSGLTEKLAGCQDRTAGAGCLRRWIFLVRIRLLSCGRCGTGSDGAGQRHHCTGPVDGPLPPPALQILPFFFYPGAKVEAEAYLPLPDQIRQTGVTCILVHMPFHMAILTPMPRKRSFLNFPKLPLVHCRALHGRCHGVQVCIGASRPGGCGLILMGAYIYGDYPDETTLTIYGSLHQSVEDHIDYTENIVEIEGGNHAQFVITGRWDSESATISAREQQGSRRWLPSSLSGAAGTEFLKSSQHCKDVVPF